MQGSNQNILRKQFYERYCMKIHYVDNNMKIRCNQKFTFYKNRGIKFNINNNYYIK